MAAIRRVLCPVDFFSASKRALKYAAALASARGARVKLLHVREPSSRLQAEEAQASLEKIAATLKTQGVTADSEVHSGNVDTEINDAIQNWKPDIVIVGTRGRRGFEKWVLGSTAERLLRETKVPLLTISARSPGSGASVAFKRILVATDFSEGTTDALDYAIEIGGKTGANITLLHVVQLPTQFYFEHGVLSFKEIEEELSKLLPRKLRQSGKITTRIEKGTPYQVVLKILEKEGFDLVIMNIHGKGILERALIGSTAERIVRGSLCPVLLIPVRAKSSRKVRGGLQVA